MYMGLARQANFNQRNFPIAGFVMNVPDGKASDLITKALSKSLKRKPSDKKEEGATKQTEASLHV